MRLKIIKGLSLTFFVLLIIGLGFVQLLKGAYYFGLSKRNYTRLIPDEGLRGAILDSRGNILADNYLSLNVSIIPQEVKNKEELFKKLSKILGIEKDSLIKSYQEEFVSFFSPVVLVADVSEERTIQVLEKKSYLRGVFIQRIPRRRYFYKQACAHILGYVDEIDSEHFSRLKKYGFNFKDKIGYGGIEEYFDSYLRGVDGGQQIQVDNLGRQVKLTGIKVPSQGKDITLSIDIRMQKIAYEVLAERRGAIVIMEPDSGKILAMASSPSFDPEIFNRTESKAIKKLLTDKRFPFVNRAISGLYPLGSVFKVVMVLAGLESGKIFSNTTYFCNGKFRLGLTSFKCWSEHGSENLKEAIVHSCNVYFFNLGKFLGVDIIYKYAKVLALGEYTGIELPAETKGLVPHPEWKRKTFKSNWYVGDTINLSIGQGELLITPLQAVRFMSAVVNGGYLVRPYIVENIAGLNVSKKSLIFLDFKKNNLTFLKGALYDVVRLEDGTGRFAQVKELTIGGKTGTAQAQGGAHGWFVGFTPTDKPKIVFAILLENIGASAYAAKVAQKMLDQFKKQEIF